MLEKKDAREKYLLCRKNVLNKEEKSDIIFNKIINLEIYKNTNVIALYSNYKDEVATEKLIKYSLEQGKIVALPKVLDEYNMNFFDAEGKLISKDLIELIIVPRSLF